MQGLNWGLGGWCWAKGAHGTLRNSRYDLKHIVIFNKRTSLVCPFQELQMHLNLL